MVWNEGRVEGNSDPRCGCCLYTTWVDIDNNLKFSDDFYALLEGKKNI
jgi:hypothetical protein